MTTQPRTGQVRALSHAESEEQWNAVRFGRHVERRARRRYSGRSYKLNEKACRLCRRPANVRPLTRHHLVPQRFAGRWDNENIVPLCRPCHDHVDGCAPRFRGRDKRLWRSMLRRAMRPGEVSYVRRMMGQQWLDRQYPGRLQLPR
jgi:5-methylcytosine-specific restriction endonuclease McrA